jgi:hypothetical protein
MQLDPLAIFDEVRRRPGAETRSFGTGLVRLDITAPCSIYISGEDGFKLVTGDLAVRSSDEWVEEFYKEGMQASYHYADDSGREWATAGVCQDAALRIWKAHPELEERLLEVSKQFLWNFSNIVEMRRARLAKESPETKE